MSTDDRQGDQPEFPLRDADGNPVDAPAEGAPATPPLPAMPAWQAPADERSDGAAAPDAGHGTSEHVESSDPERSAFDSTPDGDIEHDTERGLGGDSAGSRDTPAREPIGGPYVVTEHAPVAEQATAAYDRQPSGGPNVTSSEPAPSGSSTAVGEHTPYPAAAFAPAPAPAAVGGPYPPYQPVPQPVAPPQPPAAKGNRGGGTLIALIGAVAFAIVYAGVAFLIISANVQAADYIPAFSSFLLSAAFIVPVVVFAISLILIVLIVNRAGWWAYVLGGFLVAVLVYFAGIAGALLHVQAWNWQPQEQFDFVRSLTMDPLTLAGAIVAREASIWTGAWIAARGRKVKARNVAAREEFDRSQAEASAAAAQPAYAEPGTLSTTW
jgi:hypothetical protein